jgi:hypothetical protein
MKLERELDIAQAFYRRARKHDDRREMSRQAREIRHLSEKLAYRMGVR